MIDTVDSGFNGIHRLYMEKAIEQAMLARLINEVPIGAVIVHNHEIIATGYNKRETTNSAIAHAEIEAITNACKYLERWRLTGCSLYVTLEPCAMCMGAIVNARVDNLYFGAFDKRAGCAGSVTDINSLGLNHNVKITPGLMEEQCSKLLTDFFKQLRRKK